MASTSSTTNSPLSSAAIAQKTQECFEELQRLSFQNPESPPPILITLGRTGTGRSSSVEDASGFRRYVQWSRDPATQTCELARVSIDGQNCFIMNTPGFDPDHAKAAFINIVDSIQRLLTISRIAGFLYFTRINPSSLDEFDERFLKVVRAMSGDEFIPCLTFVTTFWTSGEPTLQPDLNARLENRKCKWRDEFETQELHFYQHGRGYNEEGEMTTSFLNWFDHLGRNQMARHIRDMISRRYCGGASAAPVVTPTIVQELRRGTPINETEAGRLLWSQPAPSATGPSPRPPAPASQPEESGFDWSRFTGEAASWAIRSFMSNGFSVGFGSSGRPMSTMGSRSGGVGFDPLSSVDVMKSFGLDSSREGRLQYAAANGITGQPFSAGWGNDIRNHVIGHYGR